MERESKKESLREREREMERESGRVKEKAGTDKASGVGRG